MRNRIMFFLNDAFDEIGYGLRCLCGKPSPMKRFIAVSVISCMLGIAFVWILTTSIYNIGKNDAKQIYIEQIRTLEIKKSNDSINHLKPKVYEKEYKQPIE